MSIAVSERSIPIRWPSAWSDARLLEILKDSPVNCLIDAPEAIATAARSTGLAAVSRAEAAKEVYFLPDPQWPGIRPRSHTDGADSGPTGAPWVDANVWSIRLAQALNPGKLIWVEAMPEKNTVQTDSSYQLAVAESAVLGARWVTALDESFAKKLAAGDPAMKTRWQKMTDAVGFFETHRPHIALSLRANLAVVSDFTGANEFLGREFLNMADRRNLAYWIAPKSRAAALLARAPGSIIYLDEEAPVGEAGAALKQAVRAGALLIASKQSGIGAWGDAPATGPVPSYQYRSLGKGRIATPAKPWDDPYVLAAEARILVGRRTDLVRLYNTGTMNALYARSNDGNSGMVQFLNYTRWPAGEQASIATRDEYSQARFVSLEHPAPELVKITARSERFSEIPVHSFAVYAAMELTRSNKG
jgi:hypothetical protein